MIVLKVRLHQHSAVYRNPITTEVVESYPLPPPSTVLGLVHSMLGIPDQKIDSMNISIQGDYKVIYRDYQWYKQYGNKNNKWEDRPKPIVVHTLYDVYLIIHFYIPDNILLNRVKSCFDKPPYYPYIGRAEDIVCIDTLHPPRMVEVNKRLIVAEYTKIGAYLSGDDAKRLHVRGILYHLPTWLREYQSIIIGNEGLIVRDFDWKPIQYIESGSYIELDEPTEIFVDEEGDFVWWCMPSPMEKH